MKALRKTWIFLLCAFVAVLLLVVVAAETTYPPLFSRKHFIEIVSIYGTDCGVVELEHDKTLGVRADALRCDVYLMYEDNPGKPAFEGQNLRSKYNQLRNGYDVDGEGKVVWDKNTIEIDGRNIRINGRPIRRGATCVTIEPNGSFQEDRMARAY